ncbi:MAG: glycosyl hydrolase [Candidatus Azobacteroides sp.]|nr:glycosyl hydrolase [Candidatus Azobacteroides sp.]
MKQKKLKSLIAACICTVFLSGCSSGTTQTSMDQVQAVSADEFLSSMGACSSVSRRGEKLDETIENMKYTGLRWLRVGYEDNAPVEDFIRLNKETGTLLSYGLLSGHADVDRLVREAKQLAEAGALLALEGSNEPNNWTITYQGEEGGGKLSWMAVAKLHRDMYEAVKSDPVLKDYPVWATCENGAQTDNVGLQFLTIPEDANTLMPAGTTYADYANCHNYISHPSWPGLHDNQTWLSSSPGPDCPVDGLYSNYGLTWLKQFPGYTPEELETLPRVTTETGYGINEKEGVTEEIQARLYLNLYLSQFKRGWKYTAMYFLKGRANEPEHESYAFYTLDNKPKQAAHYLHNFTSVLADQKANNNPGKLAYYIPEQPETTHDLLVQKSDGSFFLVLWGERFAGGKDNILVKLDKKYKKIQVYDPTQGTAPIEELKDKNEVSLTLTNHPVILKLE